MSEITRRPRSLYGCPMRPMMRSPWFVRFWFTLEAPASRRTPPCVPVLLAAAIAVLGMQQMMSFLAVRLTQEILVNVLDRWVLMRLADRLARILPVNSLGTPLLDVGIVRNRLSTPAEATTPGQHMISMK